MPRWRDIAAIGPGAAVILLLAGGGLAAAQQRPPETPDAVFRDCAACPLMTVVPSPSGAPRAGRRAFAIGVHAVTLRDWAACAATGVYCQSNPAPGDPSWTRGARPAVHVSWDDVAGPNGFLAWINAQVPGASYRLPTEAEYEHAARNATAMRFRPEPPAPAAGRAAGPGVWAEGPLVAGGAANPGGRHNLPGDAWEWVADCGRGDGPDCLGAVVRARPRADDPLGILPSNRMARPRDARSRAVGFRPARTLIPR